MSQRIGLAKAAKMLGIKRGELNNRLEAAGIESFEGAVELERVKCLAPLKFDDAAIIDRARILSTDTTKPVSGDREDASRDLTGEVRRLRTELTIESQMANHYKEILESVAAKLGEMQTSKDKAARDTAFELCAWLRHKIATE